MRLAILALLLGAGTARADSVAFTCQAAKNVKAIVDRGACAGFVAHDATGKVVQRVDQGLMLSGMLLATPDGKTVAALHTFPLSSKQFATQEALVVFRDGKPIAKYTMQDLIVRMDLVSQTVSHTLWVDPPRTDVLGPTLALTTTSQRTYTFDTATGKQLSADDTAAWKDCELIVYLAETVPAPKGGVYTIAKPWLAKGTVAAPLQLRAHAGVQVGSGRTLCVMPTKPGWVATRNLDVMFNLLPK